MKEYKYVSLDWVETDHYGCGIRHKNWAKYKKMYKRIAKRKDKIESKRIEKMNFNF